MESSTQQEQRPGTLTEEQKSQVYDQLEREERDLALEERRLDRARQVCSDEDDRTRYGYTDRVIDYMRLSVAQYKGSLKIEGKSLR